VKLKNQIPIAVDVPLNPTFCLLSENMMVRVNLRQDALAGKWGWKARQKTFHVAYLPIKSVAIFTAHCRLLERFPALYAVDGTVPCFSRLHLLSSFQRCIERNKFKWHLEKNTKAKRFITLFFNCLYVVLVPTTEKEKDR
jgi:hypothetical protein